MEETLSEVQEASRTSSEASANRNEASLQEEIETLKVIHMMIDSAQSQKYAYCVVYHSMVVSTCDGLLLDIPGNYNIRHIWGIH